MKRGWTDDQILEALLPVIDHLKQVRAGLDELVCDAGEQVHVRVSDLADDFEMIDVTVHKGTKYSSILVGQLDRGEWKEDRPYSGDVGTKYD